MTLTETEPLRPLVQVHPNHVDYSRKANLEQPTVMRIQRFKWRLKRLPYVEEVHWCYVSPHKESAGHLYFNVTYSDTSPGVLARIHRIINRRIARCSRTTMKG